MKPFPAFFDVAGRRVLIAGAGEAAARKARLLIDAGAQVEFVAPTFDPAFAAEWAETPLRVVSGPDVALIRGAALLFIAVDDEQEAKAWSVAGRAAGVPVNAVDRPALSDFATPSIIDRGDVVVAISTGGAAPVLGRRLREKIEALLPQRLAALAAFAGAFRDAVAARVSAPRRRAFWERFFDGPIAAQVLSGDAAGARDAMTALVNNPDTEHSAGAVHIVGAGPGDPELLTLRALRLIQDADVILYDRLVGEAVLKLARRDAIRLYVGKAKANHAVPQEEIEARLIAFAREGKTVVRLKGGDPFIFGRGGEELEALRAAGVAAFVTPGVTAAIGCAAAAGLPLTHRDASQALTFVTGHAKGDAEPDLDWASLARLGHTLVVYMGVAKAAAIARRLIAHGRAATTPVAIIENGTRPDQKVLTGTLSDLGRLVRDGGVAGPAILVVGDVAAKANGVLLDDIAPALRSAA
jgi:uroporphyrin-III C-methyltransferase / precorrin-2 dehydrogenase / sirohydrochlorin ferrochelatase